MSAVYILYGLLLLTCLILSLMLWRRQKAWYLLLLAGVLFGLTYDNLIIGFGSVIGEGSSLQSLNFPRYVLHALLTPLLIIVGLLLARNAGIDWAWGKKMTGFFVVMTVLMIGYGVFTDIIQLELEATLENGVLRYTNAAAAGPPIPAIVAILMLIICGIGIFINRRWPWLLIGSIVMFITSAGGAAFGVLTNLGELSLALSLLATARKYPPISRAQYESAKKALTSAEKKELAAGIRARKKRMAIFNRRMAWITFPVLIIGTVAYYQDYLPISLPDWVNVWFNTLFIILFFLHTAASFYLFGVPKPRNNIRVKHVYIGYGVFIFTIISQSLIGLEPIHMITYIINWIFIGAHVLLSTRFMSKRVFKKDPVPSLDYTVGSKLSEGKS